MVVAQCHQKLVSSKSVASASLIVFHKKTGTFGPHTYTCTYQRQYMEHLSRHRLMLTSIYKHVICKVCVISILSHINNRVHSKQCADKHGTTMGWQLSPTHVGYNAARLPATTQFACVDLTRHLADTSSWRASSQLGSSTFHSLAHNTDHG